MTRQFPLKRSLNYLVWNIKHYQPATKRPPFKASRHPFCTNTQLRDVSYAHWFEETARDFRQKILVKKPNTSRNHPTHISENQSGIPGIIVPASSSSRKSSEKTSLANETTIPVISPEEIEIVRLFRLGDFSQMYAKLKEYKNQGFVVPTELLNEMASRMYSTMPGNTVDSYLLQSVIELPAFYLEDKLRYSKVFTDILPGLTYLHKSFQLYESAGLGNEKFLLHYIWLCYHDGDLQTLQKLLYLYLKYPSYDSRTLSYVINAFVYNYDVNFAKTLFDSVVAMNKPLSEALISSTLVSFVNVGALYDTLKEVSHLWLTSDNCESPYPKTIALLVEQTYKYGTENEVSLIDKLCEALDYNNNSLVQMARHQSTIIRRDYNQKKSLTADDVNQILRVRNTLGNSKHALKVYYESYIQFFGKFCTMTMMQLILKEMKKDEIPISKFAYDSIMRHYVSNSKFVQLSRFMDRFVSEYIRFEPIYAKHIFEAFVKTYPYHGEEFSNIFHTWLEKHLTLSRNEKLAIAKECQITTGGSNMTPCALKRSSLENHKKYQLSEWSAIRQSKRNSIAKVQKQHQIQFRMNEGIRGVMEKGIRPDYHIIESTLKNLNASLRLGILGTLSDMRMQGSATRLRIHHFLLGYPQKNDYSRFYEDIKDKLNTSNKLLLARRSMNSYDFETTSLLLNSLENVDMTDGRRMISLNLKLRNNIFKRDFEGCVKEIEKFPIDGITLSPYIYHQCRYIEKIITKRIRIQEKDEASTLASMNLALEKLRGLIGDIQARLEKDDADIRTIIRDTLHMLDKWMKLSRIRDERQG